MRETQRFSKQFFEGRNSEKSNPRQKHDHYPGCAKAMSKHFHGRRILEVGCGMGWITKHLQDLGEDCEGFDVGKYAVDNAICPRISQADLMDCISWDKKWDVVLAINVLAYLAEDEVLPGLKALSNIFTEHLFLLIQTWQNYVIRLGFVPKGYRFKGEFDPSKIHGSKRRTVQTRDWWLEQMFEAEMELDWKKYKEIKFDNEGLPGSDFRNGGVGWRGLDSVFVMKHKETI